MLVTSLPQSLRPRPLPQSFARREPLPLQADQLWRIEAGIVKTQTWDTEGATALLGVWGAGDIVGGPLVGGSPYQAICLVGAIATPVTPELWPTLSEALVRHVRQTNTLLELLHIPQADIRLYRILNWLVQRFGQQTRSGHQLNFHLTHQDLADLSGLTRVTVTRLLQTLNQQGLIQRDKRVISLASQHCDPLWHYDI